MINSWYSNVLVLVHTPCISPFIQVFIPNSLVLYTIPLGLRNYVRTPFTFCTVNINLFVLVVLGI